MGTLHGVRYLETIFGPVKMQANFGPKLDTECCD